MLLFIPALILVVKLVEGLPNQGAIRQKREFLIILCMAVVYFLLQRNFNANEGLYLDYNEFVTPNSAQAMSFYLRDMLNFMSFLLFPFLAIVTNIPRMILNQRLTMGNQPHFAKMSLYLLVLMAAAAIPYILVGKSTNIFDLTDWNQRQSFVLTVPVAILTGLLLAESDKSRQLRLFRVIKSIVILIFSLSLLLNSFAIKLNRQIFEDKLIASLQEIEQNPKPGLFQINGSGIPNPAFRVYESNFLLYRAYSRASWWSIIQETRDMNFTFPRNQGSPNSGVNVYQPSADKCTSLVSIVSTGFEIPALNVFETYFGKESASVRVLEFNTFCGGRQLLNFQENQRSTSELNLNRKDPTASN
jgi:hypothetical protein